MLLSRRALTKSNWIPGLRALSIRNYGVPPAVSSDPRKDKTVQVTASRGVNIIHDPLLSKGKKHIYRFIIYFFSYFYLSIIIIIIIILSFIYK